MVTFVHVFEKCNQDSGTVVAILDDVFKQLASIAPEISTIYLRQDNAGCYHSASTLLRSPQNADHADCRLQTVQTMQTVQTVQTEYFFSNTWLTFFGSTVSKYIECPDTRQPASVFIVLHIRQSREIILEFPRKNSRNPSLNCRSLFRNVKRLQL